MSYISLSPDRINALGFWQRIHFNSKLKEQCQKDLQHLNMWLFGNQGTKNVFYSKLLIACGKDLILLTSVGYENNPSKLSTHAP